MTAATPLAMPRRPGRDHGSAGFTLFELLISIALLGLIAMLLAGGLRFGTRAWEASAQRIERGSDIHLVQSFLRRQVEQAFNPQSDGDEARAVDFQGTTESIRFTAPLMARAAPGGLYRLTIERNAEQALVLSWRPVDTIGPAAQDDTSGTQEILLEAVERIAFSYLDRGDDGDDQEPEWRNRWQDEPDTPALIRMQVSFAAGDERIWPDLLVAPRIEPF